MEEIEDSSIQLIVTSPPYYGAKMWNPLWKELGFREVITDECSEEEYYKVNSFLSGIWENCLRVLGGGGHIIVNTWDIASGRKFHGKWFNTETVIQYMIQHGCRLSDSLVWKKAHPKLGPSGSYPYPCGIVMSALRENILIFEKLGTRTMVSQEIKEKSKLNKRDLLWTCDDIWEIREDSSKKLGHVCVYPVELPYRLIKLYSYYNDIVLDPFMGSGTTAVAAKILGRRYVGYEINMEFYNHCIDRINSVRIGEELKIESSKKFDDEYKQTKLNI